MDLELSDEQVWLAESVENLLVRHWVGPDTAWQAGPGPHRKVWDELVEFGALAVDPGEGLGAIELCLISRALGAHLASAPFAGSVAARWAIEPYAAALPADFAGLTSGGESVSVALLEPGRGWSTAGPAARVESGVLNGSKLAVEYAEPVDWLAVTAAAGEQSTLVLVPAAGPGVRAAPQPAFDPTVPFAAIGFEDAPVPGTALLRGDEAAAVLPRLTSIGALLAAADAVGAAGRILSDACSYAGERRQFGHAIGSYQALRHLLADMYVRHASAWSTVLFAAAALDDNADDAAQTASIAKAYVARAAREVAHGAMQVFGGIAFTAEHPAHRFLRRIVVRERQFGDAAHHERALGRALAEAARHAALAGAGA